jgi:hypothetical protein
LPDASKIAAIKLAMVPKTETPVRIEIPLYRGLTITAC